MSYCIIYVCMNTCTHARSRRATSSARNNGKHYVYIYIYIYIKLNEFHEFNNDTCVL